MQVTTHRGAGPLQQVIEIGPHQVLTDAPVESGGEGSGPAPHDLLAAALAACTTLTVNLYARRKGWKLDEVLVTVDHGQEGAAYGFRRSIRLLGDLGGKSGNACSTSPTSARCTRRCPARSPSAPSWCSRAAVPAIRQGTAQQPAVIVTRLRRLPAATASNEGPTP